MKSEIRVGGLDGLRALAIVYVLCLHAAIASVQMPWILRVPFLYGWAGVDLFFVLSGYLIGGQVFKPGVAMDRGKILRFWLRRWFRTLPLYYFVLLVYVLVLPRFGIPFQHWNWRYLMMLQNYMPLQDFQQSWSLCIEEQFYLVFPILAAIVSRFKLKPWIWLLPGVASLLLRWLLIDPGADRISAQYAIRFPIYTHMDGLSVGVFLAATRSYWRTFTTRTRVCAALAGALASGSGLALLRHPAAGGVESVACYALIATGFGGFLVAVADLALVPLGSKAITKLALWSYGAYLWNNIAFPILRPMGLPWPLNFVGFALALPLAAVTYTSIEEPFLKLRSLVLSSLDSRISDISSGQTVAKLPTEVTIPG